MRNKLSVMIILGICVMLLAGCGHKQKTLHGIYYGYYSDGQPQKFLILAFSKDHPNTAGLRANIGRQKEDSVIKVSYRDNTVTLHGLRQRITLVISKNRDTLTCLTCNGINGPRTFSDMDNNGKRMPAKVGDIAYKTISSNAKLN